MSNVFIKPASIVIEGEQRLALVRDPETLIPLAEAGEWKRRSQFWIRRLRDLDVIEADPAESPANVSDESAPAPINFAPCEACVTPDACADAERCVKAPIA